MRNWAGCRIGSAINAGSKMNLSMHWRSTLGDPARSIKVFRHDRHRRVHPYLPCASVRQFRTIRRPAKALSWPLVACNIPEPLRRCSSPSLCDRSFCIRNVSLLPYRTPLKKPDIFSHLYAAIVRDIILCVKSITGPHAAPQSPAFSILHSIFVLKRHCPGLARRPHCPMSRPSHPDNPHQGSGHAGGQGAGHD